MFSKVKSLDRGSPAFMAPEILFPEMRPEYTIDDLKAADICALGVVMFMLANPSSKYPYCMEMDSIQSQCPFKLPREILEELLRQKQPPKFAAHYKKNQSSHWKNIAAIHKKCTNFRKDERLKDIESVISFMQNAPRHAQCTQVTSQENTDKLGVLFLLACTIF